MSQIMVAHHHNAARRPFALMSDASEPSWSGKYPSTPHLPFSPGVGDDDTVLPASGASPFTGAEVVVVVSEKLDGGNCCVHDGKVFARTHGHEADHASFGPIKELAVLLRPQLPPHLQLFGENMAAVHSIEYSGLKSYFYLFAVRNVRRGRWLPWAKVVSWAERLSVPTVPVRFEGCFSDAGELQRWMETSATQPSSVSDDCRPEGFVVRLAAGFPDAAFDRCVAKFVRAGHVQTDASWRRTWVKAKLCR